MLKELKFASTNEAFQHLANLTGKHIKVAGDNKSGLQDLMTHHYNEILRLKKGQGLSDYDTENKEQLISFLDEEMGRFKKMIASKHVKFAGIGYELYAKGADRIAHQTIEIKKLAEKVAKATRENRSLRTRNKHIRDLEKMLNVSMGELKLLKSDANNLEGYKTASENKPVALTVLGQLLVNKLWEEIERDKPGKLTQANIAPVGLMAVDQPLIENLWKKSREKHGL